MMRNAKRIASLLPLLALISGVSMAAYDLYTPDVANIPPGPHSAPTVKVAPAPNAVASNVDNYINQNDQINVNPNDGVVKVLRVNQKAQTNEFVAKLVPVKSAKVRELRQIARAITNTEGGTAEVVMDPEKKVNYIEVTAPPFQIPYLEQAITALDKQWLNATDDGTETTVYKPKFRDANRTDVYASRLVAGGIASSVIDNLNNTATHINDSINVKNYMTVSKAVDIPVSEIAVNANFYELTDNNATKIGLDYVAWKNGPGSNLFELLYATERNRERFVNSSSIYNPQSPTVSNLVDNTAHETLAKGTHYYASVNAWVTAAYFDFLKVRSKARVLATAALHTKSGEVATWTDSQPVLSIVASGTNTKANFAKSRASATASSTGFPNVLDEDVYRSLATAALGGTVDLSALSVSQIDVLLTNKFGAAYAAQLKAAASPADDTADPVTKTTALASGNAGDLGKWDRAVNYAATGGAVGSTLIIQPFIGTDSTEMSVYAQVSGISGTSPDGNPIINNRTVNSQVRVRDGEKVILAGLKRTNKAKTNSGFPMLSTVPYLGYLFGNESASEQSTDVVITLDSTVSGKSDSKIERVKATSEPLTNEWKKLVDSTVIPQNCYGFDQWLLEHECPNSTPCCESPTFLK